MEVNRQKMDLKQSFMILVMVGALSTSIITTTVMAQNMTGGNITGGNMTGKISGGLFTYDEDYSAKYGQQMAR
jgi:hypothetical protein